MRVGVGLVGYGLAGSVFHAPLVSAEPRLRLVGVSTSRAAEVRRDLPEARVFARPEDLVVNPEVDLVVVATPNTSHADLARAALAAGKHVVVDKPFTLSSGEADELMALAVRQGRLLSVFHNRRWDADFLTVRRCIESGVLGEVVTYSARFDRFVPHPKTGWREQPGDGAGILWDLGPHLIDQALVLFGLPQTIWGSLRAQRSGALVPDGFHVVLGHGRLHIVLDAGSLVRGPGPRYEVHGERGSFIKYGLDTQEASIKAGGRPGDPNWGLDLDAGRLTYELDGLTVSATVPPLRGSYESYYAGIAAAILDGAPVPVPAVEGRHVIRVIEYVLESDSSGRRLDTEWPAGGLDRGA